MLFKFCVNTDCNKPIVDGGYKTSGGVLCRSCHEAAVYAAHFVGKPKDLRSNHPRAVRNMDRRVIRSNDNASS